VPDARTALAYSRADNLFWNDIMMEHVTFFQMLMPGPELDGPRRQAEEFQRLFAEQLRLSQGITADNYVAFNRRSIGLAKRVGDYKKTMREHQAAAKMRSLVWPLFFWSKTMGEHSGFIAHLLDPNERLLIGQATKLENAFLREGFRDVRGDDVLKAAHEVLDFKTIGEKGIKAGKIKSIIHPSLASHVRREAVRFVDELKRTA
jgi:hypothetical protein